MFTNTRRQAIGKRRRIKNSWKTFLLFRHLLARFWCAFVVCGSSGISTVCSSIFLPFDLNEGFPQMWFEWRWLKIEKLLSVSIRGKFVFLYSLMKFDYDKLAGESFLPVFTTSCYQTRKMTGNFDEIIRKMFSSKLSWLIIIADGDNSPGLFRTSTPLF